MNLNRCFLTGCVLAVSGWTGLAQISPTSPTTSWTPVRYPASAIQPDPGGDQQTGDSERDIVGNAANPSLYTKFADAASPSPTTGTLGFRLRLATEKSPPGYSSAAFIGIDANADGVMDLFVGANNSGSANAIGIFDPGTGANTSPSTTTIVNPSALSYAESAANFNWSAVNLTIDPQATSLDVDGGGGTDYFLTFTVPFQDIVAELSLRGINGVTSGSVFSYIAATSSQANSLNADLNGANGGINSSSTWISLGALSEQYSASGIAVPEPGAGAIGSLALISMILFPSFWKKRKRA